MQAVPLIIAAAGAAMSAKAASEQRKERRTILNRELQKDSDASDQAAQQVLTEGQRFSQTNREAGLEQQEQKSYEQTQADLGGAGGANIATAADAGKLSGDFLKTKAARAIDEGTRLTSIAREAAKGRAPGMLQMDDSLSMAGLAGGLQNLWGKRKNLTRAGMMDAENVKEPGYGSLGRIATAVGGSMGGGMGGMAGASSGVPPNPYAGGAGIRF
jgi:hypothetical protein